MRLTYVTSIHPDWDVRIWKMARSVAALGHHVSLVCPWAVEESEVEGVSLKPFPRVMSRAKRLWEVRSRIQPVLNRVASDTDIFHFHDPDLLPIMAEWNRRVPAIYDVHENYPLEVQHRDFIPSPLRGLASWTVKQLETYYAKRCSGIVCVVPFQVERFTSLGKPICEVRNYASRCLLDSANPDDYEQRPPVVGFTGAHYVENGSLVMLQAAALVRKVFPEVKFLVGNRFASERFKVEFEACCSDLSLEETIQVEPNVPSQQIMTKLNRFKVAVSPNVDTPKMRNAIPTKIFEYMAASVPVILSDLPSYRELLNNDHDGLLVKPGDPVELAESIIRLLSDPGRSIRIGKAGLETFKEKFCWEAQLGSLEKLYLHTLHDREGYLGS